MLKTEYSFDRGQLILIDPELNLFHEEHFEPVLLPEHPQPGQGLSDGSVVLRQGNEWWIEKNGQRHGQSQIIYPSGKVKMETFYQEGLIHGPSAFFSETSQELAKCFYLKGKREGQCVWHYFCGALYSTQRFRHGHWHGKQQYFYEDGSPKTILNYVSGQLQDDMVLF